MILQSSRMIKYHAVDWTSGAECLITNCSTLDVEWREST